MIVTLSNLGFVVTLITGLVFFVFFTSNQQKSPPLSKRVFSQTVFSKTCYDSIPAKL